MVAVRSAHLNTAGEFALDEWIAGLGLLTRSHVSDWRNPALL